MNVSLLLLLVCLFSPALAVFFKASSLPLFYPQVPPFSQNYISQVLFTDEDFRGAPTPICKIQPKVTIANSGASCSYQSITMSYNNYFVHLATSSSFTVSTPGSITYDSTAGAYFSAGQQHSWDSFNPGYSHAGALYWQPELAIIELTTLGGATQAGNELPTQQFVFGVLISSCTGTTDYVDNLIAFGVTLNCDQSYSEIHSYTSFPLAQLPSSPVSGSGAAASLTQISATTIISHIAVRVYFLLSPCQTFFNTGTTLLKLTSPTSQAVNATIISNSATGSTCDTFNTETFVASVVVDPYSVNRWSAFVQQVTSSPDPRLLIRDVAPHQSMEVFFGYPYGSQFSIVSDISSNANNAYYEIILHTCKRCKSLMLRQKNNFFPSG